MDTRKKTTLIFLLMGFAITIANASAISFQIVQTDSTQDKVRASSYEIEDTLMNYFFNAGHIVTNSVTVIANDSDKKNDVYKKAFNEAVDGQCDFLITMNIEYDVNSSTGPDLSLLSNIKEIYWEITEINTGKKIKTGKERIGKVSAIDDSEQGIQAVANKIASIINKTIKSIQ
ncbi:MAG: hypothetical protein WCQ67_01830 [Treponema sp.]